MSEAGYVSNLGGDGAIELVVAKLDPFKFAQIPNGGGYLAGEAIAGKSEIGEGC